MDSTHPTAGWEKVGDRFYRKTQLYTAVFDLDLDLDNYFVAGAPYGGAVGVSILILTFIFMLFAPYSGVFASSTAFLLSAISTPTLHRGS